MVKVMVCKEEMHNKKMELADTVYSQIEAVVRNLEQEDYDRAMDRIYEAKHAMMKLKDIIYKEAVE